MIARALLLAGAALAVAAPAAGAAELHATEHGAIDLGDRIAFRVTGEGCERVRAQVRLAFGAAAVAGRAARPRPSGTDAGACTGVATVPGHRALTAAGWTPGTPLDAALVAGRRSVPLRFFRTEADTAEAVGGAPEVVDAADQDTGEGDRALAMGTGDVVSLGRVNARQLRSLGLRVCVEPHLDVPYNGLFDTRQEPAAVVSVHQGSPDGPALVQATDVASFVFTNGPRLAAEGFGGCYRLVELPFTGRPVADAPELFLSADLVVGDLRVNTVDFDGTGAKVPAPAQRDPKGTQVLFDGTGFDGWTQEGCVIADGAATRAPTSHLTDITDCSMTLDRPLHDVILRLEVRPESFFDNGGIFLGDQEIQLRQAGEFGTGGFFAEYAARAHKVNDFPAWTQIEIVQLGARHVVTVNGRTVTDHEAAGGDPEPYALNITTQAIFSYSLEASLGFGDEFPALSGPSNWGRWWFRNVRVYECAGATDPVCVAAANARDGQVPKA